MKRSVAGPKTITLLREAYEIAWSELEPRIGTKPDEIQNARYILARIIFDCPNDALISREEIRRVALREYEKRTFGTSRDTVRH